MADGQFYNYLGGQVHPKKSGGGGRKEKNYKVIKSEISVTEDAESIYTSQE